MMVKVKYLPNVNVMLSYANIIKSGSSANCLTCMLENRAFSCMSLAYRALSLFCSGCLFSC